MYACIPGTERGFFEAVCAPTTATTKFCDPPPLRNTREPESHCRDSGPKWITPRANVDGALSWGRGKPPPEPCQSTARMPPKHHAAYRRHVPQSIACRCAPRKNPLSWRPRSFHEFVNVMV